MTAIDDRKEREETSRHPGVLDVELTERKNAVRRYLMMGAVAWSAFVVTDFIAARVYGAPLAYLLALRLVGAALGLGLYLLMRAPWLPARGLGAIEGASTPLAALFVSLAAVRCGGAASPLALGVATVTLTRSVLAAPWSRSLPSTLAAAATFPLAVLASAQRAEVLADPVVAWSFLQTSTFLVMGAGVATAGGHLLWGAKAQIQEARRLGAYRLVARIGSGGMGDVWLARQMPLNRRVALKILKDNVAADPAALRRFKREAEAASHLVHPHTIRVFDFGASDDGVFFIAMELLDGLDLEAIIERLGPLPAARTVHLARQVCDSLAEAHAKGILHCDLKPANLFVTKVGATYDFAKVLDFGLARLTVGQGHTTVDTIRGTPACMPPEVITGDPVTAASDVYSMGAVLYWMLTGAPVFRGRSFHDSVLAHVSKTPERPSERLGVEVPADLEAVILKCLAKRPVDRYASARELGDALAACACAATWSETAARSSWKELRPSLRLASAREHEPA